MKRIRHKYHLEIAKDAKCAYCKRSLHYPQATSVAFPQPGEVDASEPSEVGMCCARRFVPWVDGWPVWQYIFGVESATVALAERPQGYKDQCTMTWL